MAQIPPFELGASLVAVTIQGYSIGVDGTLTSGGSGGLFNLVAVIEEIGHETEEEEEDLRPTWSLQINTVRTGVGNAGTLTTLRRYDATNIVEEIKQNWPYVLLSWTRGKVKYDVYYRVGVYDGNYRGRGGQRAGLRLRPCDPGAGIPQATRTVLA